MFDIRTPLNIFPMHRRLKTNKHTQSGLGISITGGIFLRTTNLSCALLFFTTIVFLLLASGIGTASAEENLVAVRGETVTISVTLLQNGTYGNPVANQIIEFYDQTNNLLLGIDSTDNNGLASIDWLIPIDYELGPTIVNATFHGNESLFLIPSYHSIILNILASTEIVLSDVPVLLAPGDVLSFSAILCDDTSNPIYGKTLLAYNDDILIATAITNITGGASFSIYCNNSWSTLGENTIKIVHEQDIENFYERTETLFTFEIQKIQTYLESNFSLDSVSLSDNLNFEVELWSIEGGIFSNLEILLDGSHLAISPTDQFGIGTIYLSIDAQFTLGHHFINIIYNGSERYSENSILFEIDVRSPVVIDIKTSSPAVIESSVDISISLSDILGRPIEGILTISDVSNGKHMSLQTPTDTTDISIEFPISGPVGLHDMVIEIANPFVSNASIEYKIDVWSQPEFTLHQSNILHFASPAQELTFIVQLTDWSGNISFQSIHLLCDNEVVATTKTDENGIAIIAVYAPSYEGVYNLSIVYHTNVTRYELPVKLDYPLTVSISIPVSVELDYYEVIHPLQKIEVHLHIQCLNGSFIEGIQISFTWQSIEKAVVTQHGGLAIIHLPVPNASGNYTLSYKIDPSRTLVGSSGAINISISLVDVMNSQGIGINGFVLGIFSSVGIVAIPVIKHKLLAV